MLIKNFFIVLFLFFSINVYAKNIWIVEDIQFIGLKHTLKKEALKNVCFTIGNTISEYDIKSSIQSLFATKKFKDVKVLYSNKSIIFKIKEQPIISNIAIFGNHIIKNAILNKYLIQLDIVKNNSLNPAALHVLVKNIEKFYRDLGRYKVSVKVLKIFSRNDIVNLKIIINEGISVKVNSIKILGNKNFSEKKIVSLLKTKDHKNWWNLLDKCIYSPKDLKKDLRNMKYFYLNQGYFYFHLNKKAVKFLKHKNNVNIKINIYEGHQYKVSNFFINGNLIGYRKIISDIININNNELYNREKINSIVNKIKIFLSEKGYINAKILVNPEIDHIKKTIILNFNIDMQQRFFIKKILFQGNELTRDLVLRRELKQIEGDYFDIKKIELGKEKLEKIKYLSNIKIISNFDSCKSNQINIIYQVKEQATGSINFGLGYGLDSGASFKASFSQDNLLGSGNSFKASIIKNDNQKHVDLSISYPYFIFNNIDLNTRLFYNNFKYNFKNIMNPIKNSYGLESDLGFLINDFNKFNFGFGYTRNGMINVNEKEKNTQRIEKSSNTDFLKNPPVNDFTLNYSWIFNSLKYISFPISGNQTYISGKNTIPGSDNHFYKLILDSEQYIPLNKKEDFIFSSHIHMGIGNSFNRKKLPIYENFYAGNSSNVRGFRTSSIGPKDIYNNTETKDCIGHKNNHVCESLDSIGGNATIITNLEFITPIPFINKKYTELLRSSFFLDAGNIWNTQLNNTKNINSLSFSKNNFFNDIYASLGLSLQWFSPIGPLVFSYACPIQKNKNYQLEPFQFHFGKNW